MLNRITVTATAAIALGFAIAATGPVHAPKPALGPVATLPVPPAETPLDWPGPADSDSPEASPEGTDSTLAEAVPDDAADVAADETAEAEQAGSRQVVSLGRGETLMELLLRAELPRDQALQVVEAIRPMQDPRRLRAGQDFTLVFEAAGPDSRFVGLEFAPSVERAISVSLEGSRFQAESVDTPLERELTVARGTIDSSLYQAGADAGVPNPVLNALINKLFNYDVDWQRDLQPGDSFEVMYDRFTTESGELAKTGDIHYAALTLSGKRKELFRFADPDGGVDYYSRAGTSVRKTLLRTPVDGAKLTSGFGMRRHPVLGFSKMHKGTDFGAPSGTPIYAAGSGVIDEVGPKGAYGNYVRLRHNGEISTAYAHMSRFGKNIRKGARVAQGDVIGFVGSTGRSTGPHLHYEVLIRGKQVNPLTVTLPAGRTLDGKDLKAFRAVVAELDAKRTAEPAATASLVSATGADLPQTKPACTAGPGC